MIIDIILCVIVLLLTLIQYRRGALYALRGFLVFLGAGYLTYRFRAPVASAVADHWKKPEGQLPLGQFISAAVLFILLVLVLYFLFGLVTNAIRSTGVARKADSLLGGLFGLLEGAVIVIVAAVALNALNDLHLISSASLTSQIEASHFASFTRGLASRVIIH